MFLVHRKREGEDCHWGINWNIKERRSYPYVFMLIISIPIGFPKSKYYDDFYTRNEMYGKQVKTAHLIFRYYTKEMRERIGGKRFGFETEVGDYDFGEQHKAKEGTIV